MVLPAAGLSLPLGLLGAATAGLPAAAFAVQYLSA
jgi:hypothetical protein